MEGSQSGRGGCGGCFLSLHAVSLPCYSLIQTRTARERIGWIHTNPANDKAPRKCCTSWRPARFCSFLADSSKPKVAQIGAELVQRLATQLAERLDAHSTYGSIIACILSRRATALVEQVDEGESGWREYRCEVRRRLASSTEDDAPGCVCVR